MPGRIIEDPQTPIELHADSEGRYCLRIGDRIGHVEKRYAALPSRQAVIGHFHDDADEFLDDEWGLDEHEAAGGHVEAFDAWTARHADENHAGENGIAPGSKATHLATHQS